MFKQSIFIAITILLATSQVQAKSCVIQVFDYQVHDNSLERAQKQSKELLESDDEDQGIIMNILDGIMGTAMETDLFSLVVDGPDYYPYLHFIGQTEIVKDEIADCYNYAAQFAQEYNKNKYLYQWKWLDTGKTGILGYNPANIQGMITKEIPIPVGENNPKACVWTEIKNASGKSISNLRSSLEDGYAKVFSAAVLDNASCQTYVQTQLLNWAAQRYTPLINSTVVFPDCDDEGNGTTKATGQYYFNGEYIDFSVVSSK
ncbi:MAG: hypothetical protein KDK51_10155 [Deltaproteobacteria bacterium]|nr:hypothetical protein [Deltaproteobacteria bacterium]